MEALHRMSRVTARVLRQGRDLTIPSEKLVPGDLVMIEAGDVVPADLRITEASRLHVDESALTGESVPVAKGVDPVEEDAPLSERRSMLFKGTAVTRGSAKGVVVATGMDTELGRIANLTEEAEEEVSPLEKRLAVLGYRLIWITLGIAVLVAVTGIIAGNEIFLIIETSIALAVAAIPEGLPIVATIALARGMWRMARHNALMNRLSAVETLGATSIICSDKTGTLTENRMEVTRIALPREGGNRFRDVDIGESGGEGTLFFSGGESLPPTADAALKEIIEVGVLCNNANLDQDSGEGERMGKGDPMEVALLALGAKAGMDRDELLETMPETREEAFDTESKMMATFHRIDGRYRVAVKGAPEAVLEACSQIRTGKTQERPMDPEERNQWLDYNGQLASEGLRILAAATRTADNTGSDPYESLTFLGLFGLLDPPRRDVPGVISDCKKAGIRVIMVTGDHPATARNIGISLGLADEEEVHVLPGSELTDPGELPEEDQKRLSHASIFARVTPKQKLDLVRLHQKQGAVVAMTGDGVNDAPALKKADIGIAMGRRGTQVAREAADMVLQDDAFKTIVMAISQGRAIFDNIRKFILFLLSGNVGEVMIVAFPMLAGAPLPILPLQILYLNMIGDVFPALALGVGRGESWKMQRPPRDPEEPVLTDRHWLAIGGYGLLITLPVLGAFFLALSVWGMETNQAVTVSFLTLAFARLWHVFNMRDAGSGLLSNDVTRNPFVWGALGLCTGLLIAAVYLPGLSVILNMVHPGLEGWLLILGMSLVPLVAGQVLKSRLDF